MHLPYLIHTKTIKTCSQLTGIQPVSAQRTSRWERTGFDVSDFTQLQTTLREMLSSDQISMGQLGPEFTNMVSGKVAYAYKTDLLCILNQMLMHLPLLSRDASGLVVKLRLITYQLVRSFRDGVLRSLSGRKSISFMMLASLTGSSWRRNTKEVFSHALAEPAVTWRTASGNKNTEQASNFDPIGSKMK